MSLYKVYINKYTYLLSIFDNNIINFIISNLEEKYNIYRHANVYMDIGEGGPTPLYMVSMCIYTAQIVTP